jgi:predicted membrane protein
LPYHTELFHALNADQLAPEVIIKLAQQEHRYSLLGLLVGTAAFGGGLAMVVFAHSTGSVDLLIQYGPTQIHIVTVVIGVVIALFGVIIIWMTRPNIKLGSTNSGGIEAVDNRKALRNARPGRKRRGSHREIPLLRTD